MYLYVEMFDGSTAFMEAQLGCSNPSNCRRIVRIKLTDDQIEQIKPRQTGNSGDTKFYESINPICIQND